MAQRNGTTGELNMSRRAGAHRALALYQPGRTFFWGGLLLIWGFGLALAGAAEAGRHHDHVWMWIFTGFVVAAAGLYFWLVHGWLAWIGPTGDADHVNEYVNCSDEWNHHPGENRDPGPPSGASR